MNKTDQERCFQIKQDLELVRSVRCAPENTKYSKAIVMQIAQAARRLGELERRIETILDLSGYTYNTLDIFEGIEKYHKGHYNSYTMNIVLQHLGFNNSF